MEAHEGGCLCGAIRYVCEGAAFSTNLCFCTQCQRQTGAAMPAFASYAETQVRLLRGELKTYRSSTRARRQFCAECGSSLFWSEEGSGEVDVFLGTFDDPGRHRPPAFAIWTKHRVPWLGDLPSVEPHAEQRPSTSSP